jgi:hypothetical protein
MARETISGDKLATLPKLPPVFKEWKKKTGVLFAARSPELKAIDDAIESYLKEPTSACLNRMDQAFFNWRQSKGFGEEWKKSKRINEWNLIRLLYEWLYSKGDRDQALGVPEFMVDDMALSRLGILWFFGRLECEYQTFKILTGGVIDLTKAGLDFGSSSSSGNTQNALNTANKAVESIVEPAVDKLNESLEKKKESGKRPADLPAATHQVDSTRLLSVTAPKLSGRLKEVSDSIYKHFMEVCKLADDGWKEYGGAALRSLCDYLTGKFLSDAANQIVGSTLGVAGSLKNLIVACWKRFEITLPNECLVQGMPTAIVDGIERAMNVGIGKNVYNVMRDAGTLAMNITAFGSAAIVSLVISVVEILCKTAWRIYEIYTLKAFFEEAKGKYDKAAASEFHRHPVEFNSWFRQYALKCPAIPVLVLNSGLLSKLYMLRMFPDGTTPITDGQYAVGEKALTKLGNWSSEYLTTAGFALSSKDGVANSLVKPRAQIQGEPDGPFAQVRSILTPLSKFLDGGLNNPLVNALMPG